MHPFPCHIMPDGQSGIFYNRPCLGRPGETAEGGGAHDAGILKKRVDAGHGLSLIHISNPQKKTLAFAAPIC